MGFVDTKRFFTFLGIDCMGQSASQNFEEHVGGVLDLLRKEVLDEVVKGKNNQRKILTIKKKT